MCPLQLWLGCGKFSRSAVHCSSDNKLQMNVERRNGVLKGEKVGSTVGVGENNSQFITMITLFNKSRDTRFEI